MPRPASASLRGGLRTRTGPRRIARVRGLSRGAFTGGRREATALGHAEQRGISIEPLMRDRFSNLPNPGLRRRRSHAASAEVSPGRGRRGRVFADELGRAVLAAGLRASRRSASRSIASCSGCAARRASSKRGTRSRAGRPADRSAASRRNFRACISALMPQCASIADKLAIVRCMKTKQSEHLQAIDLLKRGAAPRPPFTRPTLGCRARAATRATRQSDSEFHPARSVSGGKRVQGIQSRQLGGLARARNTPRCASAATTRSRTSARAADISADDHEARDALRRFLTKKYENERRSAAARRRTPPSSA